MLLLQRGEEDRKEREMQNQYIRELQNDVKLLVRYVFIAYLIYLLF